MKVVGREWWGGRRETGGIVHQQLSRLAMTAAAKVLDALVAKTREENAA
jgi:hypothetical protein